MWIWILTSRQMLCGIIMVEFRKHESPSLVRCSRLESSKGKIGREIAKKVRLLNILFKSKEFICND